MATRVDDCIFCKIISNKAPSEKIYEDEYVTCIKDINPASTHHYLILPNKHIRNAKELRQQDAEIYEKICSTVNVVMQKQGLDPEATLTGFHWPPFNTVHHLHLHVISPICNMTFMNSLMFKPDSYWFVSINYVRNYLQSHS
ncbi:adenosine 5'-monophosphoramidase HINT3 [Calliopsis andreniformis]|uniref:adenosine 5'-monophosphoramidase HINT3 n=1 Tax=Calliopsis andreniformis TaxID=337506 RepID=UPI003FCC3B21